MEKPSKEAELRTATDRCPVHEGGKWQHGREWHGGMATMQNRKAFTYSFLSVVAEVKIQ